jgi:competence protein ComEC
MAAVRGIGGRMPFWDRSLDLVVLTHPQDDHLAGLLEVVRRYRVGMVMDGPLSPETPLYQEWRGLLTRKGVPVVRAFSGQRVRVGEALWLEVLNPPPHPLSGTTSDVNNNSIVLRLTYGRISLLLTGDIQQEAEATLLGRGMPLRSTILKVAHHGSSTSTDPRFLSAVEPQVAVVSAGRDNRFGHPHPEVLSRLRAVTDGRVYLTSEHGTVELITDGERLWVKTER